MDNERDTDWKLPLLYGVLFLNCILWFALCWAIFPTDNKILPLVALGIIAVTTTWIIIAHVFLCRKNFTKKGIAFLYILPSIFLGCFLPFMYQLGMPEVLTSPSGQYHFTAKRGINYWQMKFANNEGEIIKEFNKVLPANKHIKYKWDQKGRLWIFSKFDKKIYFFDTKQQIEISWHEWSKEVEFTPPTIPKD